jgi:hypothetical protein
VAALTNPLLPVPVTLGTNAVLTSALWASQVTNTINWALSPTMATLTRASSGQSFTTGVAAAVSWDTAVSDAYNGYNGATPTRWTCPAGYGGTYLVIASAAWTANATGQRQLYIARNGSVLSYAGQDTRPSAGASLVTYTQVQALVTLAGGDYIEAFAMQNSGGALTTANPGTSLQALWVRS